MSGYGVKVGYPDRNGRSRIELRENRRLVGYVREVVVGSHPTSPARRWFAESVDQVPIEGTYRTKSAAVDALLEYHAAGARWLEGGSR